MSMDEAQEPECNQGNECGLAQPRQSLVRQGEPAGIPLEKPVPVFKKQAADRQIESRNGNEERRKNCEGNGQPFEFREFVRAHCLPSLISWLDRNHRRLSIQSMTAVSSESPIFFLSWGGIGIGLFFPVPFRIL